MNQLRPYKPARLHTGPARLILVCLFGMLLLSTAVCAQVSHRGRDFRFAFPPNYHDIMFDNRDSIYLFIVPAHAGEPVYIEISFRGRSHHWNYPSHFDTVVLRQRWALSHEIGGFNNSGVIGPFLDRGEQPVIETFEITSNTDIAVYALNRSHKSSEAFAVLPTTALGTHYCVLSYNSHGRTNGPELDGFSTPSQFVVVATEDSTQVTIEPSQPTWKNGAATQHITLQRNQCYLVQAGLAAGRVQADLTGTRITSSKPVAVISGHQRATIPIEQSDTLRTRNYLIEQLPPVEAWGYSALTVPYPVPLNETPVGSDLVRVLAYYDSTVISVDGAVAAVLNGGEFYEQPLERAMRIQASAPILVAQYKQSSRAEHEPVGSLGDPFMTIIPPEKQFLSSYRFVIPQVATETPEPPLMTPVIFQQRYATVVIPQSHTATLRFDGTPVPADQFTPIAGTEWAYAHIASTDTAVFHTASADTAFGLYVYGYGEADSYGFPAGMNMEALPKDLDPPDVFAAGTCGLTGGVYDSTSADSGIRSVEAPDSLRINVEVQLPAPGGFPHSALFSARLRDPYQDGSFRLVARDSVRLRTERDFVLYGFTVDATAVATGEKFIEATTRIDREVCFDIELYNYGTTTHTVSADFRDTRFSIATGLPVQLAPGEKQIVQVCFKSDDAALFRDTLVIGNHCTPRAVLPFAVEAVNDTVGPQFAAALDTCERRRNGAITEPLSTDWGLRSVRIVHTVNAVVSVDSTDFPLAVRYSASLIDPGMDGIVEILAVDEAGNELRLADTVQGRTLRAVQSVYALPVAPPAGRYDSVEVYNAGLLPAEITGAYFRNNVFFSAPLAQFPLLVPPQQSRAVHVVFAPGADGLYSDTIDILYGCAALPIAVSAAGKTPTHIASIGCNVRITLSATPVAGHAELLGGYPNPADESAILRLFVPSGTALALRLYTALGTAAKEAEFTAGTAGVYEIEIPTSDLQSGSYIVVIQAAGTLLSHRLMIRH